MITYYISYAYQSGFGATSLARNTPITRPDQIQKITNAIRDENGFAWVVILNWQRYETVE